MSGSYPLKDIKEPHAHDVLSGRGAGTNNHVGNTHWRMLVAANKELYIALPKRQKLLLSKSIVTAVRSQNPPGRFLTKDPHTKLWYDVGDHRAQEKTSQALREGAPDIRSKIMVSDSAETGSGSPSPSPTPAAMLPKDSPPAAAATTKPPPAYASYPQPLATGSATAPMYQSYPGSPFPPPSNEPPPAAAASPQNVPMGTTLGDMSAAAAAKPMPVLSSSDAPTSPAKRKSSEDEEQEEAAMAMGELGKKGISFGSTISGMSGSSPVPLEKSGPSFGTLMRDISMDTTKLASMAGITTLETGPSLGSMMNFSTTGDATMEPPLTSFESLSLADAPPATILKQQRSAGDLLASDSESESDTEAQKQEKKAHWDKMKHAFSMKEEEDASMPPPPPAKAGVPVTELKPEFSAISMMSVGDFSQDPEEEQEAFDKKGKSPTFSDATELTVDVSNCYSEMSASPPEGGQEIRTPTAAPQGEKEMSEEEKLVATLLNRGRSLVYENFSG